MLKWISIVPLALLPCLACAGIKVTAQAGPNSVLLKWNGDPKATYFVIGREWGSKQEVRRSIYPVKGHEFLDAALEPKSFQYKVQRVDGAGKVLEESSWVKVTALGSNAIAWAIYPPGDPDAPFQAGAVADGGSGSGKLYVDGAFYANTVSSKHPTNSKLHYVLALVDPKGWAKGEHSLVITVPNSKGGFIATLKMFIVVGVKKTGE